MSFVQWSRTPTSIIYSKCVEFSRSPYAVQLWLLQCALIGLTSLRKILRLSPLCGPWSVNTKVTTSCVLGYCITSDMDIMFVHWHVYICIIYCVSVHRLYVCVWQMSVPEGDATKGAKIFKQRCAQCHTTEKVSPYHIEFMRMYNNMFMYVVQVCSLGYCVLCMWVFTQASDSEGVWLNRNTLCSSCSFLCLNCN